MGDYYAEQRKCLLSLNHIITSAARKKETTILNMSHIALQLAREHEVSIKSIRRMFKEYEMSWERIKIIGNELHIEGEK